MGGTPRSSTKSSSCFYLLCALWLLSTMIAIAHACPQRCHCSERNGAVVQCTSRNLENIPTNLPKDTVVLLLSSNQITHIPKAAFMNLHRLRELDLSHNLIESLEVGAFQGVSEGLRTLDLSNNHLSSLPKETFTKMQARIRLSNNPWNCECSLQEVLRELRLDPETINEVSCHTSVPEKYTGQPVIHVLDSGINFCNFHQKTTDVAMFVAMFCWFSMVTAYIIYYIRHNQEEARRHMEYLKSLPSSSHISKDYDTASSVF
ncbi:leucine-rich repeat-containing protein 3-like [Corythoichthys intestinalis]|uniref:leucine-rich repeat-containing protein 3-like n=1 Tax=Corythoichthys intestinalis TaxID=161448 RepID=UPI0025A58BEA|nr:leucine-rich repeat-containing protein 3-like [Corythoichthys intestinalis]